MTSLVLTTIYMVLLSASLYVGVGVYVNSAHRRLLSVPSLKEQLCCLRQYLVHRCNPSLTAVPLKPVAEAELSWSLTPCPSSPPIRLQKHSGFHRSPWSPHQLQLLVSRSHVRSLSVSQTEGAERRDRRERKRCVNLFVYLSQSTYSYSPSFSPCYRFPLNMSCAMTSSIRPI